MTERLYREDPYLLDFDARVVASREHEGRPAVLLDRTAFYAESGGQPWDTGTIGDARVVAVIEEGDDVLHVLDCPLAPGPVHGRVDADRRRDHREQHHGQHLLTRSFVETAGAETLSFHLGGLTTTIDLDRPVTEEQIRAAEERANEVVWEARPVHVRIVSAREARAEGLEPPEGVTEGIRLVGVEGFDLQPCGGTHPRTTAEVGVIVVTGAERYKAGTRISFVCGHRALAALARRQAVVDQLVTILSAPLDQLPEVARKTRDDLAEGARRERHLLERVLDAEARRLLAEVPTADPPSGAPTVVAAAYDGWSPADLRTLALRLVSLAPCVALLGSRAEKAHVVFARSDTLAHDVGALLRDAVALLEGRGGGRGAIAQGGGERVDRLDEALARAAGSVRARP
jgi:alanyl-tRNA synthetase